MNKKGIIVKLRTGKKKGIIYDNDTKTPEGKMLVYLCDDDYKETGDKIIVHPKNLTAIGYID